MTAKKKVEVESKTKPDFVKGDRVSGSIVIERVKRTTRTRGYYGGYGNEEEETEERSNETFYRVVVPPYKARGTWLMVVVDENDTKEKEVKCKDFHLVGERKTLEPVLTKEEKEKIKKMTKPAIWALGIGLLVLLVGGWLIGNYNDLVRIDQQTDNSKAKIDTELTRRYDLIDNIVQSVQGSQAQESDVFGKIAEARKIGGSSSNLGEQAQANSQIDTQIALLPRLQEAYPELRSNEQVTRLIEELQGTNNTIRDKRNEYNNAITNYNTSIISIPKSIFAGMFGFKEKPLFEASEKEKQNVKVELDREKN